MQTFVILWRSGPGWSEGAPIYDQPYIEEHANRLGELMNEDRMVLSGPFLLPPGIQSSSVGLSIVKAADEADLRAWLDTDPSIVHQVLVAAVHHYQIVFDAQSARIGAAHVTS
jgi:uncharacterized protein YciI